MERPARLNRYGLCAGLRRLLSCVSGIDLAARSTDDSDSLLWQAKTPAPPKPHPPFGTAGNVETPDGRVIDRRSQTFGAECEQCACFLPTAVNVRGLLPARPAA